MGNAWYPGALAFVTNAFWELQHIAHLQLTLLTSLHGGRSGQGNAGFANHSVFGWAMF